LVTAITGENRKQPAVGLQNPADLLHQLAGILGRQMRGGCPAENASERRVGILELHFIDCAVSDQITCADAVPLADPVHHVPRGARPEIQNRDVRPHLGKMVAEPTEESRLILGLPRSPRL